MIRKSLLFFLIVSLPMIFSAHANENFLPLPLINRDDKLLNITTENLKIQSSAANLKTEFVGNIRWERSPENLLLPFLKIRVKTINDERAHLHYRYKDVTYLPQSMEKTEFTDIDFSVFDPTKIEVFQEGKKIGDIGVHMLSTGTKNKTILLDYSCSGYNVQVYGFDGEFLSIGCELLRENLEGVLTPTLKVNWISSEYKTLDQHHGPYVISFSEGRQAQFQVVNEKGEKKEIIFKVTYPKRLHRLRTSMGVGPYYYKSSQRTETTKNQILPSLMIYGNYYLNNIHSLKFFEALVMKESVFNHAGLYVGSDIGKFYDDRVVLSTLIGLQALSYRHEVGYDSLFTQMIYPQGAELAFHHPFGMENYRFTVGGFLSPQKDVIYQNFWARFGSKTFIEFNYIDWKYGSREATMYGLSIGFPLAQFL